MDPTPEGFPLANHRAFSPPSSIGKHLFRSPFSRVDRLQTFVSIIKSLSRFDMSFALRGTRQRNGRSLAFRKQIVFPLPIEEVNVDHEKEVKDGTSD